MTKDVPKSKKLARSNSFVIPLATASGLLILFLIYVFWYVSAEDKYYNDRAFRVLSVLSESFAVKVQAIGSVLGASTSADSGPAAQYVTRFLDEYSVTPEQVHATWTKGCNVPARDGTLTLSLEDPSDFSLRVLYALPPSAAGCEPAKKDDPLEIDTIVHPQASVRALFDELNEGFYDEVLIADADGVVLYQQFKGGQQISDLNDLVRLRPDGTAVVAPSEKPDAPGNTPEKNSGPTAAIPAATPPASTKPAAAKSPGPFFQISGSANIVNFQLADNSVRLYLQPTSLAIQKKSGRSRLVFCGLRSAKRIQSDTLSFSNTLVIWGALVLPLVFALGWPLLKVIYVSPKERLQFGQLLALILTILVGTVLLTLSTLNISYTSSQSEVSKDHLRSVAQHMKIQTLQEMQQALNELHRLSTQQDLLPSHVSSTGDNRESWQVAQYFQTFVDPYLKTKDNPTPPYSYFRFGVLIDADGWQRAKFTAEWPTPRVNAWKENYFQEARLWNFDTLGAPVPASSAPPKSSLFRLDLSTSPNTGEFLPILSAPSTGSPLAPKTRPKVGTPKLDPGSPLLAELLVMKFESLVDPVLPPGFGFAIVNRAGQVQFHSISRRNLLENFLEETQFNPELVALLQQGGTDFFRARYLGKEQVLYVTPLELFQHTPLSLVVFRDGDRATNGNKAVVAVYCVLSLAYILLLWAMVIGYFRWHKADYPLQGIWPTPQRQESYFRVGLTNLILFIAFLSGYSLLSAKAALVFALLLGLVAMLHPLAEVASFEWLLVYPRMFVAFAYLLGLAIAVYDPLRTGVLIVLGLALGFVFSRKFSSMIRAFSRDPVRWRKSLKHTYSFVAISLLLAVVVGPCIGFFKFAYESVERRTVQVDQVELATQLDRRTDRIHRYYDRIHSPLLEPQRRNDALDRFDLAFFNCFGTVQGSPSAAPLLQDSSLETGLGEFAEMFQSRDYSSLLELERSRAPRQLNWRVTSCTTPSGSTNVPSPALILERSSDPSSLSVVSPIPSWPGFTSGGIVLFAFAIFFLTLWLYLVASRIFLIDWRDAPALETIKVSDNIRRSTIIIGHPKSGKSTTALSNTQGYLVDIAEFVATGNWFPLLPSDRVIILDHFESGISDPAQNLNKLQFLERLIHVERRKVVLLSTVDPMFYLVSGFPEVLSSDPDDWDSSVQLLDRWAALLSKFHKATFEDKSIRRFSRRLGVEQKKLCAAGPDERKCQLGLMLINVVRQECNHTGTLRRIGYQLLMTRLQKLQETRESFLRQEVMEDVLDRADAYYRSLWSTCTKDERLVLYQLAKDGWANPRNRKAIQDLIRRKLVVRSSGLHVMNRSFRQFVLDYQYPEEVAAWDQEVKKSTWRAVRNSILATGLVLGVWLVYSQQQVVHVALGYVGVVGGAAATVGSLVSALRNRSARSAPDATKSA
jgi:hypothetical protein